VRFGDMLRQARSAKGLSQAELGAGQYSTHDISLLESGERQPTADIMQHLAAVLGMDAQTLNWWVEPASASDAAVLAAAMHDASNARDLHDDGLTASEAENAASIAKDQGNTTAWWSMATLHAQALVALRRYDEADTVLRSLRESALVGQNTTLLVMVLGRQSVVLRSQGDLSEAVRVARLAVDAAGALPQHSVVRLEAVFVLLAALSLQGRLDEAWDLATELHLEDPDPALPSRLVGSGAWVVGNIAFRRGDVEIGLTQHRLASKLLLAKTDVESWAHFHSASAAMRLFAGMTDDEVWQSLQNAQLGFRICGTNQQRQEIKVYEAYFYLRSDNFQLAEPLLADAEAAKDILDFETLSLLERLLGEFHGHQGDTLRSRRHFRNAIRLFEDAGAPEFAAEVRELMGR
jgi:transcriptional regulator with XRE-family HTH domain